jgi:hypothetical protein
VMLYCAYLILAVVTGEQSESEKEAAL